MRRLKSLKERHCSRCGTTISVGTHYYLIRPSRDHPAYHGLTICCVACHQDIESQILVQNQLIALEREIKAFLADIRKNLAGILEDSINKIKNIDLKSFFEETPAMQAFVLGYWQELWKARKTLMKSISSTWKKDCAPVRLLTKLIQLHEEMSKLWQQSPSVRNRVLNDLRQGNTIHQYSVSSITQDNNEQEAFLTALINQENPLEAVIQALKKKYQKPLENSLSQFSQHVITKLPTTEEADAINVLAWEHLQVASYLRELLQHWRTIQKLTDFSDSKRREIEDHLNALLANLEKMIPPLLTSLRDQKDHFDQNTANIILGISRLLDEEQKYQHELTIMQVTKVSQIIENSTSYTELEQLEQRFPILSNPSCPKEIKIALEKKRQECRWKEIRTTAMERLKDLETAVKDEEWWPVTLEKELLECVSELPPNEQLEIARQMMTLFQEFSEKIQKTVDDFMETYPEVFQKPEFVPVKLTDDTGWGSLLAFDLRKNKWIPAWDRSWYLSFPRATYLAQQSQDNSNKKKRRARWTLMGEMPIGTLLMISYPRQALNYLKPILEQDQSSARDDQTMRDQSIQTPRFVSAEKAATENPKRIRRYFIVCHQPQENGIHIREIHPRPREILKLISFMQGELTSELLRSKAVLYTKKVAPSEFAEFFKILRENENIINGIRMIEEASSESSSVDLTTIPSLGMTLHAVLSGTNRQAFQQQYLIISRLMRENDMKTLEKVSKIIKSPHIKLLLQSYKQIQSLSAEELNLRAAKKKVVFVEEEETTFKCTVCFETITEGPRISKCIECNIPTCNECAQLLMEEASPCPGYLLTGRLHLFSLL